jgi:hypothetical protein
MRFFLAIALFSVLAEPAYAEEPTQPNSGTQLIELCNRDRARCEQIIVIVIKTGVDAGYSQPVQAPSICRTSLKRSSTGGNCTRSKRRTPLCVLWLTLFGR